MRSNRRGPGSRRSAPRSRTRRTGGRAYLAINPRGFIPAIEAEGPIVTETVAILAWIGHRWPESGQLPLHDLPPLARVFEMLSFFATTVHYGGYGPIFRARAAGMERPSKEVAADRERLRGLFREIEAMLQPGPFLLGEL